MLRGFFVLDVGAEAEHAAIRGQNAEGAERYAEGAEKYKKMGLIIVAKTVFTVAQAVAPLPCHSCAEPAASCHHSCTEPASCYRHSRAGGNPCLCLCAAVDSRLRGNDGGKAVKRRSAKHKPTQTQTISGIFLRLLRNLCDLCVFDPRIPAKQNPFLVFFCALCVRLPHLYPHPCLKGRGCCRAQGDDYWGVVAGALVFAGGFVDVAGADVGQQGGAGKDVINSHTEVAAKGKVAVVPPGVAFFGLGEEAQAVVQAKGDEGLEVGAFGAGAVDGFVQGGGVPDVGIVEGDVVVAHEQEVGVGL